MSPKLLRVALGMITRSEKVITVEVPDDFDSWEFLRKQDLMHDLYDADEGDGFFEDHEFCPEEGTHFFIGDSSPAGEDRPEDRPDFRVSCPNGDVNFIEPLDEKGKSRGM